MRLPQAGPPGTPQEAVTSTSATQQPGRLGTGETWVRERRPAYRHEAYVCRGDEEFLAGAVPFVQAGLAADEPVLVAVPPAHGDLLHDALGADAALVRFADMSVLGHNPARIIPAWQEFAREWAGPDRPVRGIGEPIWAGRRTPELAECQLHEALLNSAVEPSLPLWLLCPYDAATLPEEVVAEAYRSHPIVVETTEDGMRLGGSTTYSGSHHVGELFEAELPTRPAVTSRGFGMGDLAVLRNEVAGLGRVGGLDADRADDLALAVHEIAANALEHGSGSGTVVTWREPDAFVCEVCDPGHVDDPMVGRRQPDVRDDRGRGLWMANQLCDLVQIRSGQRGTTVRVHTWL